MSVRNYKLWCIPAHHNFRVTLTLFYPRENLVVVSVSDCAITVPWCSLS